MAKIKTLIPFTTIIDGEYFSPRKGEIIEVSDDQAEEYIAEGMAEAYTLVEPTGKITITENGTDIDVAQYAKADVDVDAAPKTDGKISFVSSSFTDAKVWVPCVNYGTITESITVQKSNNPIFQYIYGRILPKTLNGKKIVVSDASNANYAECSVGGANTSKGIIYDTYDATASISFEVTDL